MWAMWVFALVLLGAIVATFAMGVWFISIPLALLLVSLPALGSLGRRITGTQKLEQFRAQADHDQPEPPHGGRDASTLFERDRQDQPPAAYE